jgi:hypothetical protein
LFQYGYRSMANSRNRTIRPELIDPRSHYSKVENTYQVTSMPQDEEIGQREASSAQIFSGCEAQSMLGEVAEPELRSISHLSLTNSSLKTEERPVSTIEVVIQDYFACQKWHRPYAEALIETDPAKRTRLILEARRAILDRYLELCLVPAPIEESRDLWNAVTALSEMETAVRP